MNTKTPSYRLHKGSGQAVVTLNGRDIYLGLFGSIASKAEYDRLIAEWLRNGRQLDAGSDLTVTELVRDFLVWADGYYRKEGSPTSEIAYLKQSFRPLLKLYGPTLAADFRPSSLETVRDAIVASGACRNVVNGRVNRVIRLFRWGVSKEKLPAGVHHSLATVDGLKQGRTHARESERVKPVPDAFVDAVEPHVAPQVWTMIGLQRLTGMRPGEVTTIRTGDLDTSGKVWVYTPGRHKTEHHGKERPIYLGTRAQALLRPWLRTDLDGYLFQPAEAMAERQAERTRNRKSKEVRKSRKKKTPQHVPGDHYTPNTYRGAVVYGCKKADVPEWHPNQLRHNAATFLRKEFGIDVARVILGHSSPSTTQIYAEIDQEKARRVMGQIG